MITASDAQGHALEDYDDPVCRGLLTVTTRTLVVTATGIDRVYDGTVDAAVSLLTGNAIIGDDVTVTYSSASFADKNAGTGKLIKVEGLLLAGAARDNYSLLTDTVVATANVFPRTLTVTATGENKVYDGTISASVR